MQPVEEETMAGPVQISDMQPVEADALAGPVHISDIPDDAFGQVLLWLPPLTTLAATRIAKQWRVRVTNHFARLRELDATTMNACLLRGAPVSGPARWGHKSSRLAMLLGRCRSLESLTVGFGEFESAPLGNCPSDVLRFTHLRRLVIDGDYMSPDCVHSIARLNPNLEEFKWRDHSDGFRVLGYDAVGTLKVLHRHCRRLRRLPPFGCCCGRHPSEPDGPCGFEAEAFELLKTWPSLRAIEIHQCFPLSLGEMLNRTFGFAKDTGQFKGKVQVVLHDVDDLECDEDAGGDVPRQIIMQRDFSKNNKRPMSFGDPPELPPY